MTRRRLVRLSSQNSHLWSTIYADAMTFAHLWMLMPLCGPWPVVGVTPRAQAPRRVGLTPRGTSSEPGVQDWKVTIMGDSTWLWKTSSRQGATQKLVRDKVNLAQEIVDLGACGVEVDMAPANLVTYRGYSSQEGFQGVSKAHASNTWSTKNRLLVCVDNDSSSVKQQGDTGPHGAPRY